MAINTGTLSGNAVNQQSMTAAQWQQSGQFGGGQMIVPVKKEPKEDEFTKGIKRVEQLQIMKTICYSVVAAVAIISFGSMINNWQASRANLAKVNTKIELFKAGACQVWESNDYQTWKKC